MGQYKDSSGRYKTPLYSYYEEEGVKLTDFGGWALPIQFTNLIEEHHAVRQNAGIFDVSHMGEILVEGSDATTWLNRLITNNLTKCEINESQYTALVNEQGGTLDDLIIYRLEQEKYLLVPNASNREKIYQWLVDHNGQNDVQITDQTFSYGLLAIQGPEADSILQTLTDTKLEVIKPFTFVTNAQVAQVDSIIISRTGYTGESGFELYIPWEETQSIWEALLTAGQDKGIQRCGLGARDTLRLEAGLSLYGNDLTETINPIEAGISFVVDFDKEEFIGKEALQATKDNPDRMMSRGFELQERGVARQGYPVYSSQAEDAEEIGEVTSGTMSPTFNQAIGFVLLKKTQAKLGNDVYIGIRKKRVKAILTKKDWLRR